MRDGSLKLDIVRSSIGVRARKWFKESLSQWQLFIMVLLPVTALIIFSYTPMLFLIVAFKDYSVRLGPFHSPWVGWKYFRQLFGNPLFTQILRNTLAIGLYGYIANMIFALLLAFSIHSLSRTFFKKSAQMITYAPYFLSTVVVVGIILQLLDTNVGQVNIFRKLLGKEPVHFMGKPELFSSIVVWSGVWQTTGYTAVIYLAALSGVDPSLHEAARVDGATRLQRLIHIDFPGIASTVATMLILHSPTIIKVGYQKAYLLQNNLNMSRSQILSTYIYEQGVQMGNYSLATVADLFNSVLSLCFVLAANILAKRASAESSLF